MVIILLAVAVGSFRLLIAQLPQYQAELRSLVAEQLGVEVDFEGLDARLGLRGPELTLSGASLRVGEFDRAFVVAERAFFALSTWDLIMDRRIALSRLTLDGVRVTVERTEDGELRLLGIGERSSGFSIAGVVPESMQVDVRDSQLLYIDRGTERSWQFSDVDLSLARLPGSVVTEVTASPPAELSDAIELAFEADIDEALATVTGWRLAGAVQGADLEVASQLFPLAREQMPAGSGDIRLALEWSADSLVAAEADISLVDVRLPGNPGLPADFEELGFSAAWNSTAGDGWHLSLERIELARSGRAWPVDSRIDFRLDAEGQEFAGAALDASFVRLDDLGPLFRLFPESQLADQWRLFSPRGEISDLSFELGRGPAEWSYEVSADFADLGVDELGNAPGVRGLTGSVRADARSGTIAFASPSVDVDWPWLLDDPFNVTNVNGSLVWRQGRDGLHFISNDLGFDLFAQPLGSSFDLLIPPDGSSPRLDLEASLAAVDLVAAKRFLPRDKMPAAVGRWLDSAVRSGRGSDIDLSFYGLLADFPFDQGRGQFRVAANVEDTTLAYIADWPAAESLDGHVEFQNARFRATGSGRVLGHVTENIEVGIDDMRAPVLTVKADTVGPLADVLQYLREAPLLRRHFGDGLERLQSSEGDGLTGIDLTLPLLAFGDYRLTSTLDLVDAEVALDGFGPTATDVNGRFDISNDAVTSEGLDATFLGGPVSVTVSQPDAAGYRSLITFAGEIDAGAVQDAFEFQFHDLIGGQTRWDGSVWLPRGDAGIDAPLTIGIASNLTGIALRFPAPLAKAPAIATNLQLEFVFDSYGRLRVDGNLGATRRVTLDYELDDARFLFRRGAIRFGGEAPELPLQDGISLSGSVPALDLNEWLRVGRSSNIVEARPLFHSADLEIVEFQAYGQQLGSTSLRVGRGNRDWLVDLESEAIAGRIEIPRDLSTRDVVIADMSRVYLAVGDGVALDQADPRRLPGLRLRAEEFGFSNRQLGRIEADVAPDPRGLRLVSFRSDGGSFSLEGSGSWLANGGAGTTRIAANVTSTDVITTLNELGLDPVVAGESAELTASVYWDGGPSGRWLDHVNGDVALRIETGSLVEIDPGAGRVLGLMSIAALPRRLMLDFRDVFNRGFAFDEITGNFTIIDGNAFTDNLKMSGPTAEIGVIGRTGLRDRDYQQQAVVTAEPSNMLPTVGGIIGGPGVGAALLLFTRLFKEPLRGIGRAAYCVTGPWDAPEVERMEQDTVDAVESCVALPKSMAGPDSD